MGVVLPPWPMRLELHDWRRRSRFKRDSGPRRRCVITADVNKPTFLEILEDKQPGMDDSGILRRRLREGSGFTTLDIESVDIASAQRSQRFARGRQVFQQSRRSENGNGDDRERIAGRGGEEEEGMPLDFSNEVWKERRRKMFEHGTLGGSSVRYEQGDSDASLRQDRDTAESDVEVDHELLGRTPETTRGVPAGTEEQSAIVARYEALAATDADDDQLAKFMEERRAVSKTKQDWRALRKLRRSPPGVYEVREFPYRRSDLRTEGKPPLIKGPVYGPTVERVVALVKNLSVNDRVEDVLDSVGDEILSVKGQCNLVMQALGERGYDTQALSCFQWMRTHDPCLLDEESFPLIFSLLKAAAMDEEALNIFNGMPEAPAFHSMKTYNVLIQILAHAGRSDGIEAVLKKMHSKGLEPDSSTFTTLITVAQKARHSLQEVWDLFQSMKNRGLGISITVYGNMVKAFCDAGRRTEALAIVSEMERSGRFLSTVIYNTLIDAYAKAGEMSQAEGLFEEITEKGYRPNVATYNILVSAYGRLGQYQVSETLIKEMEESGLDPDVVTYSSLISAYGELKMSEQAANTFLRMKKRGIQPNAFSYTALIHAYCEGRWHEKAAAAFEVMKREGVAPTVESYTALLNGFKQAGNIDKVKSLWKEMRDTGIGGTRITYNVLVDTFCKHGYYQDARAVVFEFKKMGIHPNLMTFNMLINAYARGGEHERAEGILTEIKREGFQPDAYTYSTLVYAFLRVRDYGRAFKYHNRMCKTGKLPDRETYAKLRQLIDEQVQRRMDNIAKGAIGQLDKLMSPPGGKLKPKRRKNFWKTKC